MKKLSVIFCIISIIGLVVILLTTYTVLDIIRSDKYFLLLVFSSMFAACAGLWCDVYTMETNSRYSMERRRSGLNNMGRASIGCLSLMLMCIIFL